MSESAHDNQQEAAYRQLRRDIVLLALDPGQRLVMGELCDQLGIGRTPVRGALQQLQKEGLIKTIPQSGTYVTKIDMTAAENARFVRETVEKEVASECAALARPADLARIDQIIELQQVALEMREFGDFFVSDNLMHQAFFEVAGRLDAWRWLNIANADLERYRLMRVRSSSLDWHTIIDQHRELRDAIGRHDTTETRFITSLHLHMMLDDAPRVVRQHPEYFA